METNTTEPQTTDVTAEAAEEASPKAEQPEAEQPEENKEAETEQAETASSETTSPENAVAPPDESKATEGSSAETDKAETDETDGDKAEIGEAESGEVENAAEEATEAEEEAEAEPIEPPMLKVGKEDVPLTTILESLLFVAEVGIKPSQFAQALECPVEDIQVALKLLGDGYKEEGRGLRVQERGGRFTMVTTPIAAKSIEAFLELDLTTKLSGPALEALSVIAYRQPVTRPQIESVRGVDCGGVIKTLLQHEMIEEVGRLEAPGRPILYGITDFFMQHFGLTELQDLPPLETTEADMLWAATQIAEAEGETEEGETDDLDEAVEESAEAAEEPEPEPESETEPTPDSDKSEV